MGKHKRKVIPRSLIALPTLAKKCPNVNAGMIGKQISLGAWGEIEVTRLPHRKTRQTRDHIPREHAQAIIDFHRSHTPLETVAKKHVKASKNTVRREIIRFNALPLSHEAVQSIGGKIGIKKMGFFNFIPNEHISRVRSAVRDFITVSEAARRMPKKYGISDGILAVMLQRRVFPEAASILGRKHTLVHKSILRIVREFFTTHYSFKEAARRAGVSERTMNFWIAKWGFPVRTWYKARKYFKKEGFDQCVREFKKGRQASQAFLQKIREKEERERREEQAKIKVAYTQDTVFKRFGIKKNLASIVRLFNEVCRSGEEQVIVGTHLTMIWSLKAGEQEIVSEARELLATLLLEAGGIKSSLFQEIKNLENQRPRVKRMREILALLKTLRPEQRAGTLKTLIEKPETLYHFKPQKQRAEKQKRK